MGIIRGKATYFWLKILIHYYSALSIPVIQKAVSASAHRSQLFCSSIVEWSSSLLEEGALLAPPLNGISLAFFNFMKISEEERWSHDLPSAKPFWLGKEIGPVMCENGVLICCLTDWPVSILLCLVPGTRTGPSPISPFCYLHFFMCFTIVLYITIFTWRAYIFKPFPFLLDFANKLLKT